MSRLYGADMTKKATANEQREAICLCAICHEMLYKGDVLVEQRVYDIDGELDYILLAHAVCAPNWQAAWGRSLESANKLKHH